eukprot:scaffold542590_cov42-Prasinocladus_malaysianus.AAC.1
MGACPWSECLGFVLLVALPDRGLSGSDELHLGSLAFEYLLTSLVADTLCLMHMTYTFPVSSKPLKSIWKGGGDGVGIRALTI